MRYTLVSLLVFLLCLSVDVCARLPVLYRTQLHLLTYESPPYVYLTESQGSGANSDKKGLAIEVIDSMMDRAGIPFSLSIVPVKRGLIMTEAQANTCVFPIERSQEKEVKFTWVSPVIISRHAFFKKKNSISKRIKTLTDALPYSVGSYLGSGIGDYLESLGFKVDYASDNTANLKKLNANRIELWASDVLSAAYISQVSNEPLGEAELVFFTTLKSMACNSALSAKTLERLNKTLRDMYRDGSMEEIHKNFAAKSN